jgi:L-seryl-tRNA(Ser) seleniumtransferase
MRFEFDGSLSESAPRPRLPNRNPGVILGMQEPAVLSGESVTAPSGGALMLDSMKNAANRYLGGLSRRELFRRGSLLAATPGVFALSRNASAATPTTAGKLQLGADIYKSIGVRPLINCRGTLTVISGSMELPEVRAAADSGGQHHVALDELMEGVARRLAELTGAEWALVSAGCAAGMAHTTAACVTGGNPDLHVRIPDLSGFAKDEVVIPKASRNEYDQAIRSVGVRIVEVGDAAEYEAALGPKVAMVYVMSGNRMENGPLNYDVVYGLAKKKNIPVFTDAAAEMLTVPNVYLQRGSTFVGYSGGKCLRGPQCSGLILGRKDLLQAAWVSSAPHHGHGRTMKIGKEEILGLLAAVEMWVLRDHSKEDEVWTQWMQTISDRVTKVDGVTAAVRQPRGLNNHSPGLSINWDTARLGITGEEVSNILWTTEPRIALIAGGGVGRAANQTGVSITAYMMMPEDVQTVADRLYQILSAKRPDWKPETLKTVAGDLTGRWDVRIDFAAGSSDHAFHVKQQGNQLMGTHQGDFVARDFSGTISGDDVRISSSIGEVHGAALAYRFMGKLAGDKMSGALDMGEYLGAKWTATRHAFGRGGNQG